MSETTAPFQSRAPGTNGVVGASGPREPGVPARPSQAAKPSQADRPVQTARPSSAEGRKKYDYVRVKLFLPGTTGTTISLDPELVQRAAQALGSEQKVKALAATAALGYIKGVHPARTRSAHAARALQMLLTAPLAVSNLLPAGMR